MLYYVQGYIDYIPDIIVERSDYMKKFRKLTALIASAILAVSAMPLGTGAEILKGDINQDGVVDIKDAELLDDFMWNYFFERKEYTEEEIQYYITYGDMNGDGKVWHDDIVLMGEVNSDITLNTELGDVNHDGYVDSIDATAVMWYYCMLSTDHYDYYTAEEHENFQKYGNMSKEELGDDYVDCIDASLILQKYAGLSATEEE
ncbi:MAG: hypothetical protein HDT23_00740 [Ruminococcus sp.]|nr:hypothetical protein [Ruminococcus sp.]